jgi:hypothetical protein
MKYNFKYFIIFLFIGFSLFASFEKREAGAREQSLGNSVVALNNTPFALLYNPANIQSAASFNVYTGYRNFYGLPGIYQADIVANTSIYGIGSAFAVSKYGNDLYSEMEISAGGSYNIAENLSLGLSLQGYFLSIKNYGDAQSFGLNLGVQYDYLETLSIGAFVTNVNNPKIGSVKEELPQTFSLGLKYNMMERATLFFELFRDVKHDQDYRGGFEYEPYDNMFLRIGVMDNTNSYSFGVGSSFRFLHFDYALIDHSVLGISHAISLGVDI